MKFSNNLKQARRSLGDGSMAVIGAKPTDFPPVRILSGRAVLAALCLLALAPLAVGGCGHATVPCPTPTRELDRLRAETEQARAVMERALAEDWALKARRETAAQRAMVARQTLDSLAAAGAPR